MKDKRNKRAQERFTRTTEMLRHGDLRNTEDPGAIWGSSSTTEVSQPHWELRGREGQCPVEGNDLATEVTDFRTGQESLTEENQGKTQGDSLQIHAAKVSV